MDGILYNDVKRLNIESIKVQTQHKTFLTIRMNKTFLQKTFVEPIYHLMQLTLK